MEQKIIKWVKESPIRAVLLVTVFALAQLGLIHLFGDAWSELARVLKILLAIPVILSYIAITAITKGVVK